MKQKWVCLAGILLLLGVGRAAAQQSSSGSMAPVPAALESQIECSGFISPTVIPKDLYVGGGADNEFLDKLHAYTVGDYVYLINHRGPEPTVGSEYRLVRPGKEKAFDAFARRGLGPLTTFGPNSYYPGQQGDIRSLGTPYEDIGRVKIIKVTPEAAVAQVTAACMDVDQDDIAMPFQPRPVPTYTPTAHLDRFASPTTNPSGGITAARDDVSTLGDGDIGYISLGQADGIQPGQKLRVTRILRPVTEGAFTPDDLPPETVGEAVVLWTEEKSAVIIVVSTTTGVNVGDAVQIE